MRIDLEKTEEAKFDIDKEAFTPKSLTCSECNIKMKKSTLEIGLENGIYIKIPGFECPKCRKTFLGLEEAMKMDKAMIINRILGKGFKLKRSLSFDGDNYTFRIPKEFTHDVHKKKIEITPLGANEFCAVVE